MVATVFRIVHRYYYRTRVILLFLLLGVLAVLLVVWLNRAEERTPPLNRIIPFKEPPWAFLKPVLDAEPSLPPPPRQCNHSPVVQFVHQTWSSTNLPPRMSSMRDTWRRCFPKARHYLWTDADNHRFVRQYYPWFMRRYNALPTEIYRADAIRYLLLFHYGGIYADLDTECLSPFSHLLANHSIVFGAMAIPKQRSGADGEGVESVGAARMSVDDGLVQNSFMFAKPRHPFWMEMVHYIMAKPEEDHKEWPEDVTGPQALMYVLRDYRRRFPETRGDILVYPPKYFNPFSWMTSGTSGPCRVRGQMSDRELELCRKSMEQTSYVVQYHFHTWTLPP